MDYKEYSRLRSIARKRIERASAAGAAQYVRIPTVAEVRASANPSEYMAAVKQFLNVPTATLKASKKQGVSFPTIDFTPVPPGTTKQLSEEAKKARRREQKRRSKAKRKVEQLAKSEAEARKQVGYLKALETVAGKWREAGVDIGNWIGVLSPGKAKKFVDYMEYRFSQGDYNNRYTIDTFIRDFGELVKSGYDFKDIQGDFGVFLEKQKALEKDSKHTNKYGIAEDEVDSVWRKFVKKAAKNVLEKAVDFIVG